MLKKGWIAAVAGLALLLAACQNPPVNNIVDAPLGAPPGVTLDQVRQAIMFAGNKRGWQMRQDVPGKIVATHQRSGHMAIVDILYTTTTFSIVYYESASLQYNAGAKTVHPTYNRWVDFLAQDIQTNAAALATDGGTSPGAPPPAAAAEPGASETAPEPGGVSPGTEGAAPAPTEVTPSSEGAVPATEGAMPTDSATPATGSDD